MHGTPRFRRKESGHVPGEHAYAACAAPTMVARSRSSSRTRKISGLIGIELPSLRAHVWIGDDCSGVEGRNDQLSPYQSPRPSPSQQPQAHRAGHLAQLSYPSPRRLHHRRAPIWSRATSLFELIARVALRARPRR